MYSFVAVLLLSMPKNRAVLILRQMVQKSGDHIIIFGLHLRPLFGRESSSSVLPENGVKISAGKSEIWGVKSPVRLMPTEFLQSASISVHNVGKGSQKRSWRKPRQEPAFQAFLPTAKILMPGQFTWPEQIKRVGRSRRRRRNPKRRTRLRHVLLFVFAYQFRYLLTNQIYCCKSRCTTSLGPFPVRS